jgi:hypothetical protein
MNTGAWQQTGPVSGGALTSCLVAVNAKLADSRFLRASFQQMGSR